MYHTTLQAMPGQELIFGRDMVLNVQHLTDWTVIKAQKQIIHKNNQIENSKCIPHHYQVGDLVMLENNRANKYKQPYSGPYGELKIRNEFLITTK